MAFPFFLRRLQVMLRVFRPRVLHAMWKALDEEWVASCGDLRVRVLDFRPRNRRDPQVATAQITRALQRVSMAGQGFGELVADHLERVVLVPGVRCITTEPRAYWDPFDDYVASNEHYLACLLVWAATAIRLARDARYGKQEFDRGRIAVACREAQRRFVECFPDGPAWVEYLKLEPSAV